MRCDQVREQLAGRRYGQVLSTDAHGHRDVCVVCQGFACAGEKLDALLSLDEPQEPRPGFDTRFFARLAEVKAAEAAQPKASLWRWWLVGLVPLGAAAALVLLIQRPGEPAFENELALAVELELLESYEVVKELEDVEAYEVLAFVDLADIERIELEGRP